MLFEARYQQRHLQLTDNDFATEHWAHLGLDHNKTEAFRDLQRSYLDLPSTHAAELAEWEWKTVCKQLSAEGTSYSASGAAQAKAALTGRWTACLGWIKDILGVRLCRKGSERSFRCADHSFSTAFAAGDREELPVPRQVSHRALDGQVRTPDKEEEGAGV